MNENPRVLSLMSLCMKAGRMQTGETAAEKLLQNGEACMLVIAGDASDNTKKKFINKCFYYKKPVLVYGERDALSKSVGKQNRTVFILTDPGFAGRLRALIEPGEPSDSETGKVNTMEVAECPKPAYMS